MKTYITRIASSNACKKMAGILAAGCILTLPLAVYAEPIKPPTKNIIVMISDGCGHNHMQAASYYEYGESSMQIYNEFPFQSAMSTYMLYAEDDPCHGQGYDPELAWGNFNYVKACATDSAAAATAMSTGVKTRQGAIGVDISGQPLANVLEFAEELGKATGVVTTVPFNHATPAGFVAHNPDRMAYGAIAQEMINDSAVDVIMGCGNPWFNNSGQQQAVPTFYQIPPFPPPPFPLPNGYVDEQTWDELVAGTAGGDADGDGNDDPWTLIQTRSEFEALMNGDTPQRVIGIPQVFESLQVYRGSEDSWGEDPYVVSMTQTVPTLEEMTKAALNILDDDPDGMLLMIEGGAVDFAGHEAMSGRMIEEQLDFDRAVEAVVDWVKANSNWGETLLIVTADHETGYLTGPGSDPTWEPIVNNGIGNMPGMEWHPTVFCLPSPPFPPGLCFERHDHTNSLVPVFAKGDAGRLINRYADAYDPEYGPYVDNTELAEVVFGAMGPL